MIRLLEEKENKVWVLEEEKEKSKIDWIKKKRRKRVSDRGKKINDRGKEERKRKEKIRKNEWEKIEVDN